MSLRVSQAKQNLSFVRCSDNDIFNSDDATCTSHTLIIVQLKKKMHKKDDHNDLPEMTWCLGLST